MARMRWLVVAVACSGSGCMQAYRVKAASAAAAILPASCSDIAIGHDERDGWLWPGVGCGKRFWCSYDEHGAMVCAFHPNRFTPRELNDVAQVTARCEEPATGREVNDDLWEVYLCGKSLDCEDRGPWVCHEAQR